MRDAGIDVDIWSHTPGSRTTALLVPFASNRLPTPLRILVEVIMGVEIMLHLAARRFASPNVVVVLSSPPYVTCFLAANACRLLGLRYIWDARDIYPEVLFNFGVLRRESIIGIWLTRVTSTIYRYALFVSTPSDAFVAIIRSHLVDVGSVNLIRNGFDEKMFVVRPSPRDTTAPFVCINHGLLGRMHNIQLLLDVADIVYKLRPDIEFWVIGSGPKQNLLLGGNRPNVRYFGHKAYTDIPGYLAEADLGLAFIEDTDGTDGAFPVKLYEYIGAGLPALVTPRSEAGRLVESEQIGAGFGNGDALGIAHAIIDLSDRGDRYTCWRGNVVRLRSRFGRMRWSTDFARLVKTKADARPLA